MSARAPDDVLEEALATALESQFGGTARIERIERRPSPYSTSFAIEEIDVHLEEHDDTLRLIFKDLGWHALVDEARDVRPRFLHDPHREIAVYRDMLATSGLETAQCFGSHIDEAERRYWLFLERVTGPKLCHVGDFTAWERAARWLAHMHTRLRRFADQTAPPLPLIRYDRDYYRQWVHRAQPRLDGEMSLLSHYDAIIDRLCSLAQTFIHGEFYAGNVLLRETGPGRGVCPIDWETAAAGPALMDLAALAAGKWDDAKRMALIAAYRQGLMEAGAPAPSVNELATGVDLCRAHQAVQWLGWAADWTPPAEEAQDWLAELRRVAGRLEESW